MNREVSTNTTTLYQQCTHPDCKTVFGLDEMLFACKTCGASLAYEVKGRFDGAPWERKDMWKHFPLLPLEHPQNIVSLDVGGSQVVHIEELTGLLNGANLYVKMDSHQNPTGTFKDREASLILSRCKELGLDNLVFYSTGNTGRAYTHYAAHMGLTSYFFMPKQCQYKNTDFIKKNHNNYIIFVDDNYPEISPYAKRFAKENGLTMIAPLHDRTEAYASVAYEQFRELPQCDYFVQTIASGMGPIGFYLGHLKLVRLGLEKKEDIPTLVCVQSSEMNVMSRAYNSGRTELSDDDRVKDFPDDLFEPTLNSTNPVKNYPQLYKCLQENNGIITDVEPRSITGEGAALAGALEKRGLKLRLDLEKSLLISFAGLVKLAEAGQIRPGENIMLLAVGRGKDDSHQHIAPDAVINPAVQDPAALMKQLNGQ